MGLNNDSYSVVVHLLAYPFAVCSCPKRQGQQQQQFQLQDVIEVWELLYISVNHDSQLQYSPPENFPEDLSSVLNGYLNDVTITVDTGVELQQRDKNRVADMLLLIGKVIVSILEQLISRVCSRQCTMNNGNNRTSRNVKNCLEFASR